MLAWSLRARSARVLLLIAGLSGCANSPPLDDSLNAVAGKPFSASPGAGGDGTAGGPAACGIFTCRYIAVGSPACADYYASDGWTQDDAATDCKAAAAFVKTDTVDANPQTPCIDVGASSDGNVGGQCMVVGATPATKARHVYAYGMTEGLCTGIVELEGTWNAVPFNPCPDAAGGDGGAPPLVDSDATVAPPAPIFSCRYTEGLLAAERCTDYPGLYGWDEAKANAACDELNGMLSSDAAQACIEGGFQKRCAKPDQSYVYGVDSCDGLLGALELLGAAQPPEEAPFAPYSAVQCGNDGGTELVFTCRYDGFARSCADYPESQGWSEESATAHCTLLPNSSNHELGGPTCLKDSEAKSDTTRCKVSDPAVCDQTYYGYDIPDFVCDGLIAGETEFQKPPYDGY